MQFNCWFSSLVILENSPFKLLLLTSDALEIIVTLKFSVEENIPLISEVFPISNFSNEGFSINIPFCSGILFKWKEDKLTEIKFVHSRNIPAVFCKEEVSKFSKPFILTNFLHPPNKKSIFSTLEEEKDVKSTVSKFMQLVKVYIILVIEEELNLIKLSLIKSEHPSNIKSKEVKDTLKISFI